MDNKHARKRGMALDPRPTEPLITDHNTAAHQDDERVDLYSRKSKKEKPNYYHTAMNYPLAFYTMTQSARFIPRSAHVRFNPGVRRRARQLCCETFFTYPVILLAPNSISMLRKKKKERKNKRGSQVLVRQDSRGSQVFFWETTKWHMCVCVCIS